MVILDPSPGFDFVIGGMASCTAVSSSAVGMPQLVHLKTCQFHPTASCHHWCRRVRLVSTFYVLLSLPSEEVLRGGWWWRAGDFPVPPCHPVRKCRECWGFQCSLYFKDRALVRLIFVLHTVLLMIAYQLHTHTHHLHSSSTGSIRSTAVSILP